MNSGRLSLPKTRRSGSGQRSNGKLVGLLAWPLAIAAARRVANFGSHSRRTIASGRSAIAISMKPIQVYCRPNGIARLEKRVEKPRTLSASTTRYDSDVPIWCAKPCHSVKSSFGMNCAFACSLITTTVNWSASPVLHQFSLDHYLFSCLSRWQSARGMLSLDCRASAHAHPRGSPAIMP